MFLAKSLKPWGRKHIYCISTMYQKFPLHILSHLSSSSIYHDFGTYLRALSLLSNHLATPVNPGRTQDKSFRCLYLYVSWLWSYLRLCHLPSELSVCLLAEGVNSQILTFLLLCYYQILSTPLNFMSYTIVFNHSTFKIASSLRIHPVHRQIRNREKARRGYLVAKQIGTQAFSL